MSIFKIRKHSFGDKKYLLPSDHDDERIRSTVYARSRFSSVSELMRRLDRIDEDDFSENTNKYFISADHINDAYIAVLAIYGCIADKMEDIGGVILLDDGEGKSPESNVAAAINLSAEMTNPETADMVSCENNPVIHTVGSLSAANIGKDILLDERIEFFICCPPADRSDPMMKVAESCCRCVFIDSESSEDPKSTIIDYFWERDYDPEKVDREINALVRALCTRDEYVITAAARQVIGNHLYNDPDSRVLAHEDFAGMARLFSASPAGASVRGSSLVGLDRETEKINGIINSISIDKLRFERGISTGFSGCSMVFAGPPGTAKTTLARLFAEKLGELGIIKGSSCFRECTKSDYVGQYVGHTAAKIDSLFSEMSENGGGVIFFDEIYTLSEDNATIFDKEAVTCITQNMENYRGNVFCIFAGYENKMDEFLSSNPGLRSRMSFTVKFSGYSDETLCSIFRNMAAADNYKLPDGCDDVLCGFFSRLRSSRGERFGNGREARNLLVNAKQKHALRISSFKKKTSKMLTVLEIDDISSAAEDILSSELESQCVHRTIGF
ncbi:MAG: AAA family ATPase [Oscillospiraceae bacterium]